MQIEYDVHPDLLEWGKWVRACPSKSLHYPSSEPFTIVKGGIGMSIPEDWALLIDVSIAKLFHGDEQAIELLVLYYVCGWSLRDIERKKEISYSTVKRNIDNSVSWLNGYFAAKCEAA